jgi:hypothetical protein
MGDADNVDALNTYWEKIHPHLLSTIAYKNQLQSRLVQQTKTDSYSDKPNAEQKIRKNAEQKISKHAHDSRPICCWQLSETTTEFVNRLPPSSTRASAVGQWIYVRNPHVDSPVDATSDENGYTTEDIASLVRKGQELLQSFENQKAQVEVEFHETKSHTRSHNASLTRKIANLRSKLETEIFQAARIAHVTTGKWMLFPYQNKVDEMWTAVVGATIKGNLGVAAKVATHDPLTPNKARLIAVYTRDHENRDDIRRVLRKLIDMGLVGKNAIYYKCDAYTYLGIDSKNPYGLRASRYSSKDILTK